MTLKLFTASALGALVLASPASAADFKTDILPMLESKCMGCHRAPYKTSTGRTKKPKGKLRLDNPEEIAKGGDSGNAIVPKDVAKSLVIERVTLDKDHDDVMPPQGEGKPEMLTEAELKALKEWIAAGAEYGDWKGTEFNDDGTKK